MAFGGWKNEVIIQDPIILYKMLLSSFFSKIEQFLDEKGNAFMIFIINPRLRCIVISTIISTSYFIVDRIRKNEIILELHIKIA